MAVKQFKCPPVLDKSTGHELMDHIHKEHIQHDDSIVLDMSNTTDIDSLGGAWLVRISDFLRTKKASFEFEGIRGSVSDFMEMIRPSLEIPRKHEHRRISIFEEVGERIGLSRERIRQLQQEALGELRDKMERQHGILKEMLFHD